MPEEVIGGMQPFKEDERDFNYGSITELGAADLSALPKEFIYSVGHWHTQLNSDMCTGFSVAEVSEDQEGVVLHPEAQFMLGKKRRGDWQSWGNDTRSSLLSCLDYGSVLLSDFPDMVLSKKSRDFLANWNNWPMDEVLKKAAEHKKSSFFIIKDRFGIDLFDSIRLALWENRDSMRTIVSAANWHASWNHPVDGIIPKPGAGNRVGHQFEIIGYTGEYLVIYPNYGKDLGKNGLLYMPRAIANQELIFAYMFVDMPVDVAKFVNKYNGKAVISTTPPKIWFIQKGKKRHIPSMEYLYALGFEDKAGDGGYLEVPEGELLAVPTGDPVGISDLSRPMQQLFNSLKIK